MIWTTRDGRRVKVKDMTDRHLLYAHRFVCNQVVRIQEATESFFHPVFGPTEGSIAEFYAEQEMQEAWDQELLLLKWKGVLESEIKRRGLTPLPHRKKRELPRARLVESTTTGRIFKLEG